MGQYCFAGWRLSSSSVTLPACAQAGRRERGNTAWEHCRRWGGPAAGHMGGWAADTARRASRVTSH